MSAILRQNGNVDPFSWAEDIQRAHHWAYYCDDPAPPAADRAN